MFRRAVRLRHAGASRYRGQRAFVDDGVTDVMPGRCRVAGLQQRLPVQHGGVALEDFLGAGQETPSISAASRAASAISHRGPERIPDSSTGETMTTRIVGVTGRPTFGIGCCHRTFGASG
jgi:hypothetical protein